jgi:hypothetical protein
MTEPSGFAAPHGVPPQPTSEWPQPSQWTSPASPGPGKRPAPWAWAWIGLGLVVIAGIIIVLVAASGGRDSGSTPRPAAVPSSPTTQHITGTLTLNDSDAFWSQGSSCSGSGGYSDLDIGGQVTLTDDTAKIIGATTLSAGTATSSSECDFNFAFDQPIVPSARFYSVEVTHRGKITDSADELRVSGWAFSLSIGN